MLQWINGNSIALRIRLDCLTVELVFSRSTCYSSSGHFHLSAMGIRATLSFWLPVILAQQKPEVDVNVYEGPTECDPSDKLVMQRWASLYYVASIAQSSEAGEPGKIVDEAYKQGSAPFHIRVAMGEVFQGLDEGLVGLCKGAKATLTIPPELILPMPGVPEGATLEYDIEILTATDDEPQLLNVFVELDVDKDNKLTEEECHYWFIHHHQGEQPGDVFKREDADGDGFITWEEFSGPKGESELS